MVLFSEFKNLSGFVKLTASFVFLSIGIIVTGIPWALK